MEWNRREKPKIHRVFIFFNFDLRKSVIDAISINKVDSQTRIAKGVDGGACIQRVVQVVVLAMTYPVHIQKVKKKNSENQEQLRV